MSVTAVKITFLQFNKWCFVFPEALQNLLCLDFHEVLCRVCSVQPGGVQSEHLPHLPGADPSPEPDPVLRLQRRVSDLLEFSGRAGNRALPNAATVHFSNASSSILVDSAWTVSTSVCSGPLLSASSPEWAEWRRSRPTSSLESWWTQTVLFRYCWCRFCC